MKKDITEKKKKNAIRISVIHYKNLKSLKN